MLPVSILRVDAFDALAYIQTMNWNCDDKGNTVTQNDMAAGCYLT